MRKIPAPKSFSARSFNTIWIGALDFYSLHDRFGLAEKARRIVQRWQRGGWMIYGKTGAAYPRHALGWGWFVGWAQDADQTLVFARLTQTSEKTEMSPGNLTRDAFLQDWPRLVD